MTGGIGTAPNVLRDDELVIEVHVVRALVDRALPECAPLPLSPLGSSGFNNALFRLGDGLLVRLPRQLGDPTVDISPGEVHLAGLRDGTAIAERK